jgi:hypothetical protein
MRAVDLAEVRVGTDEVLRVRFDVGAWTLEAAVTLDPPSERTPIMGPAAAALAIAVAIVGTVIGIGAIRLVGAIADNRDGAPGDDAIDGIPETAGEGGDDSGDDDSGDSGGEGQGE